MENNFNNQFTNDIAPAPDKPQFLKVLCILTFIGSGLMILAYLIGSLLLGLSEETATMMADKVMESNPQIQIEDPVAFFHDIGMVSLLALLANIASLVGAIMMWNLNKIGFFIYAIAELSANFFGMNVNAGTEQKSYGMMVFVILIDIVFIAMYAIHLKYMNKNKVNTTTQF